MSSFPISLPYGWRAAWSDRYSREFYIDPNGDSHWKLPRTVGESRNSKQVRLIMPQSSPGSQITVVQPSQSIAAPPNLSASPMIICSNPQVQTTWEQKVTQEYSSLVPQSAIASGQKYLSPKPLEGQRSRGRSASLTHSRSKSVSRDRRSSEAGLSGLLNALADSTIAAFGDPEKNTKKSKKSKKSRKLKGRKKHDYSSDSSSASLSSSSSSSSGSNSSGLSRSRRRHRHRHP